MLGVLHTYIIGHYNSSVRIIDIISLLLVVLQFPLFLTCFCNTFPYDLLENFFLIFCLSLRDFLV